MVPRPPYYEQLTPEEYAQFLALFEKATGVPLVPAPSQADADPRLWISELSRFAQSHVAAMMQNRPQAEKIMTEVYYCPRVMRYRRVSNDEIL